MGEWSYVHQVGAIFQVYFNTPVCRVLYKKCMDSPCNRSGNERTRREQEIKTSVKCYDSTHPRINCFQFSTVFSWGWKSQYTSHAQDRDPLRTLSF